MVTFMVLLAAQAAAAAPPAKANPPAEKMKCQLIYQANSRIPDRLCLTQAEWDKMADANKDDLASSRNARSSGSAGTIESFGSNGEASIGTISPGNAKGPGPH